MDALDISSIVFGFILAGVMLGAVVRPFLSEQHLNADAKDVVKTATAFMATLSALVLGLLIATAKSSFDTKNTQVRQLTANVILVDGLLEQYGPAALNARQIARRDIAVLVRRIWHEHESNSVPSHSFTANPEAEKFFQELYALSPQTDMQRALKERIVRAATNLAQERLSLFVQSDNTISMPFLMILTFWLTMIFAILSLMTRLNLLIAVILLVCALSVSASVFLILDLDRAFSGVIQISSEPLRNALSPNIR